MIKIFLMGKHSHRTPFSYPVYRSIFQNYVRYVDKPELADIIIWGYVTDFDDHLNELRQLLKQNSSLRLVVVSEEPLWDTTYNGDFNNSGEFDKKHNMYKVKNYYEVEYTALNHVTSSIYQFAQIPYFITTSDDYFARYSFMFNRNSCLPRSKIKTLWGNAGIKAAFYAEKRTIEKKYNVKYPEHDIYGLSIYRTKIADGYNNSKVLKVGQGWSSTVKRQDLPDWHLDKLCYLDKNVFILSALENTHERNYITEKLFDAFAVLAVPLYFASQSHNVGRLVPPESFINLFGLSVEEAIDKIDSLVPNDDYFDFYCQAQSRLAALFSSPFAYVQERRRVVAEAVAELSKLL